MEKMTLNKQTQMNESDSIKVVSMLYDGAVDFIRTAKEKLEQGDSAGKTLYIRKTCAIVKELSNALNVDGGEIAQNLSRLYDYVLDILYKADMQNDTGAINDAEKVIEILRDAWEEMQQAMQLDQVSVAQKG